jgi:enoyl-CoA hydratase/carnithine racemase
MGGGMGISQGARLRVVNERSKLAMPETHIGLFPDVGGGWFLAQCPGHTGEWLALTGQTLGAADAIELGLADLYIDSSAWDGMLRALRDEPQPNAEHVVATVMERVELAPPTVHHAHRADIDRHFGQPSLAAIVASLQADADKPWVQACLKQMAGNSPLMMAASLELVRRGRQLGLADELRLELDLVWRCFEGVAAGAHSETVEGIRALAIDKDHQPRWQPSAVADVDAAQVSRLLSSPWSAQAHPLAQLGADAA